MEIECDAGCSGSMAWELGLHVKVEFLSPLRGFLNLKIISYVKELIFLTGLS